MTSLLSELTAIAGAAFAAEGYSAELGQIQLSDRPDLAQFQCNGALAAGKARQDQSAPDRRAHKGEAERMPDCSKKLRSQVRALSISA